MEWDARTWMLFMWGISGIIFCCAFSTPYTIPGNRVNTFISFGGNNVPLSKPDARRFGLWTSLNEDEHMGHMRIVQALMCAALLFGVAIGFGCNAALIRCGERRLVQILLAAVLLVGALCDAAALLVFYVNLGADDLNQGFWMALAAGGMWVVDAVCLLLMPIINVDHTLMRKKHHIQMDGEEAGVPLTKTA